MSSSDLVSMFIAIELQSYGRAPCEACVMKGVLDIVVLHPVILAVSIRDIIGHGIPPYNLLITIYLGIAGIKGGSPRGLPLLRTFISGCSHGQDNKSDTY